MWRPEDEAKPAERGLGLGPAVEVVKKGPVWRGLEAAAESSLLSHGRTELYSLSREHTQCSGTRGWGSPLEWEGRKWDPDRRVTFGRKRTPTRVAHVDPPQQGPPCAGPGPMETDVYTDQEHRSRISAAPGRRHEVLYKVTYSSKTLSFILSWAL